MEARIRELRQEDIPELVAYWAGLEPEDMDHMGVDPQRLPDRLHRTSFLQGQLQLPKEERSSYALIWEVDGHSAGHSNINPIQMGNEAFMHLHLWKPSTRGRGVGTFLVKRSAEHFMKAYALKRILSEPMAANVAPNRCLERAGFRLVRTYVTTPGSICRRDTVNRWELTAEELRSFD